ncbi:MAG: GTP-binding protein [Candidatus Omnitrophota bacterium]
MAFINYNNKEITVKIVYYGPALSGKTTCLRYIYEGGEFRKKGKLITLDTEGDRTLFFDFLPIEVGKLGDYSIKMQLYTVPGQVAYNTTRKLVLQGSDGIVFVAESQAVMREQNIDSFKNLKENLKANNISFEEIPLIFQYNKRDLREILPIDALNKDLNPDNKAFFPSVGTTGENILEALHAIMKKVIFHLKNKLSIFQKDKTVMFSREEMLDAAQAIPPKKNEPVIPPVIPTIPTVPAVPTPPNPKLKPNHPVEFEDTEKEDIFELSSSLAEEPLKTVNYKKQEEEDIFNLADENRVETGELNLEIPEMVLTDEELTDKKDTNEADLSKLKNLKDEPVQDISEPEPGPLEVESWDDAPVSPVGPPVFADEKLPARFADTTVSVPIHIEIPEDKSEVQINLNLHIIIKKNTQE